MNPQHSHLTIDALSHIFTSKLNLKSRANSCASDLFSRHFSTNFPKDLSLLRVGIAPDCFVGVRVADRGDAHALNALNAPLMVAEGPFGRVYVKIEEIAFKQFSITFKSFVDNMDVSEDEMYWSDIMDLD